MNACANESRLNIVWLISATGKGDALVTVALAKTSSTSGGLQPCRIWRSSTAARPQLCRSRGPRDYSTFNPFGALAPPLPVRLAPVPVLPPFPEVPPCPLLFPPDPFGLDELFDALQAAVKASKQTADRNTD